MFDQDGVIVGAAQEERFTRLSTTQAFPTMQFNTV